MSYAMYNTDALVCGTFDRNTADRSYLLFTREAGMLFAEAKSVREERSRQRYALQDFSRIRVSLVKGKRSWKIGSVESLGNDFSLASTREARGGVVSIYRLLRRFIAGEEPHRELFDLCLEALALYVTVPKTDPFIRLAIEARLLAALGYVDASTLPPDFCTVAVSSLGDFASPALNTKLELCIEQATRESQL